MDPHASPSDISLPHRARIYRPAGSSLDVVLVLAHGAGGGQAHPFMVRYAQGLANRGLAVVTFDFPYMQAGRKAPDRAPVLEAAFLEVVAATGGVTDLSFSKLLIGGKSMGGRIATHLAAAPERWPERARPLRGVVVLGYPLNPPGGPSKASPDRVSHLARIDVPVLVVQGTRDAFGRPEAIAAALGESPGDRTVRAERHVHAVSGGDHSLAARFDQDVWGRVIAFASSV